MFLVNSRFPLVSAALPPSPRRGFRARAPLLPRLRGHFAEFLHHDSLVRLGILCPTTCVGLGYGRLAPRAGAFLGATGSPCYPPPSVGSPSRLTLPPDRVEAPGFAWGPGCALERAKPSGPRGYHCASPLLIRLPTSAEGPQTPHHNHQAPPKGRPSGRRGVGRGSAPARQHGRCCTGTGISTRRPSTTPVGLALGPDSPRAY